MSIKIAEDVNVVDDDDDDAAGDELDPEQWFELVKRYINVHVVFLVS